MGCNPIVFVGLDLAFTGMQQYASGVVSDASTTPEKLAEVEGDENTPILKKDIFGNPTYTQWKWVAESKWISEFSRDHPLTTLINCTEGGLGFANVPNRTLRDVAEEYMSTPYALHSRVHGEIQNSSFKNITDRKVSNLVSKLRKSLLRVIDNFDVLIEEAERSIARLRQGAKEAPQSGLAALAETELVEEDAYTYVLDVFNEVYARLLSREGHAQSLQSRTPQQKAIDHLELSLKKYAFLQDTAKMNANIIDFAREEDEKEKAVAATEAPKVKG